MSSDAPAGDLPSLTITAPATLLAVGAPNIFRKTDQRAAAAAVREAGNLKLASAAQASAPFSHRAVCVCTLGVWLTPKAARRNHTFFGLEHKANAVLSGRRYRGKSAYSGPSCRPISQPDRHAVQNSSAIKRYFLQPLEMSNRRWGGGG